MACPVVLSGHKKPCKRLSGLFELYLIDKSVRLAVDPAYTFSEAAGELTITPPAVPVPAYKIELTQNTAQITNPITSDNNSRTGFFTQTLELRLDGISAANSYLASQVLKGTFEALAVTREGEKIYLGYDETAVDRGLEVSGGDGSATGQSAGDANGVTLTLTFESKTATPLLNNDIVPSVLFDVVV